MRFYFYRGKGIWATLIRWFTRSKYAHVSVVFDGDGMVYESAPGRGVIKGPLKSVEGVTPFVYKDIAHPDALQARDFCERALGMSYDYWGCICFILGIKQSRSATRYFCSEFVADVVQLAGAPLQDAESFKLSPDILAMSPMITVDHARKFQWDHAGRYV